MLYSKKQPIGFSIFFLTEMWERYGFYVIQTLLIFYLVGLKYNDSKAYAIVGSFTALAYINSLFGGVIADKFIGRSYGVLLGGVILSIGYYLFAVLGDKLYYINLSLSLISIGTGLLKPNVSSLLSTIYVNNQDDYKDSGYTLYYVGIYVGALSGSILGGYIKQLFGWDIAFYSSSLGCVLAILVFSYGTYRYNLNDKRIKTLSINNMFYTILSLSIIFLISYFVMSYEQLADFYFLMVGLSCISYIMINIIKYNGLQRKKLIAFLILIICAIGYWGVYFQQFFSISLCIARTTNSGLPDSILSAAESLGVILFGPLVNLLWQYLLKKRIHVSVPIKFSLGFLFNALGFLVILLGLFFAKSNQNYMSIIFVILAYFIISIGELSISPTSLSMVSTLIPEPLVAGMTGMSLLSIGFGGKLAAVLAGKSVTSNNIKFSLLQHIDVYYHAFFYYFILSCVIFGLLFMVKGFINKLIKC
jgi:POT family proton-dependent oligopeptide transporter